MRRFTCLGLTFVSALVVLVAGGSTAAAEGPAQASSHGALQARSSLPKATAHSLNAAARLALRQGYLVPDQAAYERQKAAADSASAGVPAGLAPHSRRAPIAIRNFAGVFDPNSTPSDSTGAIGTTRYIELVNSQYAIYDRTSSTPLDTGTLGLLAGAGVFDSVFDPQVKWDPATSRFYYAMDDVVSSSSNFLAIGFSKTSTPNSSADFCQYAFNFGANFPDYPKLGDSKDFELIGSNVFGPTSFLGADVAWYAKPAAGTITTCPSPTTFKSGVSGYLKNANGSQAATLVPSNQSDTNPTGYIVSSGLSGGSSFQSIFKVTKSATGTAVIQNPGSSVAIPAWTTPPSAPQMGTTWRLDTLDGRDTQAELAIDPAHANVLALWTQHTVKGGAGSEVRWYEINPATRALVQSGKVTSTTLYDFNGSIAPDRLVNGATKKFGGNIIIDFNTSSKTTFPAIWMVSKQGTAAQSAPVLIIQSAAADIDFGCGVHGPGICRWGDYSGNSPDPGALPTGVEGQTWFVNMWNSPGGTPSSPAVWKTQIVEAQA